MRVAIDATAIPANRAGAGNYILNLVRSLAQVDAGNQYLVFAKNADILCMAVDQPNFRFIPVQLSSRPARLSWEQTSLPYQLARLHADVLHSPHYTMPLVTPCKSVVTFCDMTFFLLPHMHERAKRYYFRLMMQLSARRADRLLAISEATRGDAIRLLKLSPDRIATTPLGADPQFRPLSKAEVETVCRGYGLKPKEFLYYVGVLEPRKNLPLLLRAYAGIAREFPSIPLVIAGRKGWFYEEVFRLVTELSIQSRVIFLGYVPDCDLVGLYNGARAFIYPSHYEGFGLPVLEAMQCGTPVVTTNISSLPEVAGDAALLVAPDDFEGLSMLLRRVLTDDRLVGCLSERGLLQATEFSWHRCAQETLKVYEAIW